MLNNARIKREQIAYRTKQKMEAGRVEQRRNLLRRVDEISTLLEGQRGVVTAGQEELDQVTRDVALGSRPRSDLADITARCTAARDVFAETERLLAALNNQLADNDVADLTKVPRMETAREEFYRGVVSAMRDELKPAMPILKIAYAALAAASGQATWQFDGRFTLVLMRELGFEPPASAEVAELQKQINALIEDEDHSRESNA